MLGVCLWIVSMVQLRQGKEEELESLALGWAKSLRRVALNYRKAMVAKEAF